MKIGSGSVSDPNRRVASHQARHVGCYSRVPRGRVVVEHWEKETKMKPIYRQADQQSRKLHGVYYSSAPSR